MFGIEGRYAHAMYSAAAKQKNLEQVESELSKVDELIRTNDKLSEYLANPTLDKYKKQCELKEVKCKPLQHSLLITPLVCDVFATIVVCIRSLLLWSIKSHNFD